MAYNDPNFSFGPNQNFTFDPNSGASLNPSQNPYQDTNNPYVETCDTNGAARDTYKQQVTEYVNNYGQVLEYWSTGYDVNDHNMIYGENPTARYRGPRRIKAVVDFTTYTTFLSKYGMMSDLDITIYIPIDEFTRIWGPTFPMNGDLFRIVSSACDRPMGQDPIVFEVTEKHDSINAVDFMGGHYTWKIIAKRYDNSYEPGAPQEKFLGGPVDSGPYGSEGNADTPAILVPAPYPQTADEEADEDFLNTESSVYGKY